MDAPNIQTLATYHLIDYAVVRQRDVSQGLVTRVMRGADCWTDHRLVVTKLRFCLYRPRRSCRSEPSACLNGDELQGAEMRKEYARSMVFNLPSINKEDGLDGCDWGALSSHILDTATTTFGRKVRKNEYWFNQIGEILTEAIDKHRRLLRQHRGCDHNVRVAEIRESNLQLWQLSQEAKDKWCFVAESLGNLQQLMSNFHGFCFYVFFTQKFGLLISVKKTEMMSLDIRGRESLNFTL